MGSAAAWHLARRGVCVLGFDRFRPPHTLGSSTGQTRIIREAYFESPFYVPMVRRAFDHWRELEARAGKPLLQMTGGITIGPADGPLVSGAVASARAHGVPYQELTPGQVRERFPFQPDDSLAGVWDPGAGILFPEDCIEAFLGQAAEAGADLHFDEPITGWQPDGAGVRVATTRGEYLADCLILAAGAWMPGLARAGIRLPLQVARQTLFWFEAAPELRPPGCPIWLWETREGPVYYGFPDLGNGAKAARHHAGAIVDPTTVDRAVAESEAGELSRFLAHAVPGIGKLWDASVCLYTNTPDEHFIIDRHPDCPAVILASPCSGHGFKFAPAVGEILADLAVGREPGFDLAPFRLDRFS